MEKKAKIIATLGPAIYSENKLKKLVDLGVDAFRINFSHNTNGINKIVSKIRKVEKINGKKLSLIACLLYTSPSPRDYAASRMPSSA